MTEVSINDLGDAIKYSIPLPSRCCGEVVPKVPVESSGNPDHSTRPLPINSFMPQQLQSI